MTLNIKQFKTILCISTITLLFGCAGQPMFEGVPLLGNVEAFLAGQKQPVSDEQEERAQTNTKEYKLPSKAGDIVRVHEHNSEAVYDVSAEKVFNAASGRLCIYYHEPGMPQGKDPNGLACRSDDLRWIKIPLKIIRNTHG